MSLPKEARFLMQRHHSASLATHSKKLGGYPFGSVTPYILDHGGRPVILISDLAEHTKNIDANEKVSLLVAENGADVQAGARLTLVGDCTRMADQETPRSRYLRYFPNAANYFATHDFFFYRIEPKILRYIGGFGKIHWLDAKDYTPPQNHLEVQECAILTHMNNDHRHNLIDYSLYKYAKHVSAIEMIGIDCDGFDVMANDEILRFYFPSTIHDAAQARAALVDFAQRSRA